MTFTKNDEKLVQEIRVYQEAHGIKSFTEAVRQLCRKGLSQSVDVKINLG